MLVHKILLLSSQILLSRLPPACLSFEIEFNIIRRQGSSVSPHRMVEVGGNGSDGPDS